MTEIKSFAPPPKRKEKEISEKSAVTAALLALFLGFYGVHNFYLGYKSKAVIQLILGISLVGCFISGVWGIAEAIMLFSGHIAEDGKGKILRRG